MNDVMSVEQMAALFDNQWILIGDPETDASFEVLRGRVLFHSSDADEVYRKAAELRPARFATIFTGEPAEDMEFAL